MSTHGSTTRQRASAGATISAAARLWDSGSPLAGHEGRNSDVRTVTIGGRSYVMKRLSPDAMASPAYSAANEVATWRGLGALGMRDLGPARLRVLTDSASDHTYVVISHESGTPGTRLTETAETLARTATPQTIQRLWLAEYVLGMQDRYAENLLLNGEHARHVDFGLSLKPSPKLEIVSVSLRALADHAGGNRENAALDSALVRQVVARRAATLRAVRASGVYPSQIDALRQRFDALAEAARVATREGRPVTIKDVARAVGRHYVRPSSTPLSPMLARLLANQDVQKGWEDGGMYTERHAAQRP